MDAKLMAAVILASITLGLLVYEILVHRVH